MNVQKISNCVNFQNTEKSTVQPQKQDPEFIDRLLGKIKNKRDVEDCVAVPRGIFKAYLFIMGGFALLGIGAALPQKLRKTKTGLSIVGNILNFISAIYFAKGFAIKGVSPTVNLKEYNK